MLDAKEARRQFQEIDTNRDGYITYDEFKADLQRNPKVDAAEFRFEPPPGADVLGEK